MRAAISYSNTCYIRIHSRINGTIVQLSLALKRAMIALIERHSRKNIGTKALLELDGKLKGMF
jgi:hypothetical protein